jgi:hypothetical protein
MIYGLLVDRPSSVLHLAHRCDNHTFVIFLMDAR